MKILRRITLAMGILCIAFAVNAQKFGHITSEELLQGMPEFDSAQIKVQELRQQYDLEIERIQVEINKKIEEFNQTEATLSNLIREAKASEIQEMQVRLQNFAQTAQQDLQQQSSAFIQPVMDKARKAIDEVAKELGLIYVFDLSQGNPVYTSEESVDMLPLVKAKIGL
ncbi:MAG: OmpH family outer membrane protein [Bacteroidales bacterium]|nr:OmpH family outer membrane protein [Bacteroidales bacterium]